jgi:hypothetical protein
MNQWSKDLVCDWHSWEVNKTNPSALVLRLAPGQCCDMAGAIRVAQRLMPEVEAISTYSGDKPDVTYSRQGKDWQAYPARQG